MSKKGLYSLKSQIAKKVQTPSNNTNNISNLIGV